MPFSPDQHSPERHESESERLDRNYSELLQELRVAQAGVQILFAFLLSLAFQSRFETINGLQRTMYVVALITAAAAAALLIAPVAFHRLVFRRRQKDDLVEVTNSLAIAGLVALFFAMVSAVLLILDVVLGNGWAVVLTVVVALWFLLLWFVLPLPARRSGRGEAE
jgi:cation transport ATPase